MKTVLEHGLGGTEIDRRIAELKGWTISTDGAYLFHPDERGFHKRRFHNNSDLPWNWTTSEDKCVELLDDFPSVVLSKYKYEWHCDVWDDTIGSTRASHKDRKVAICLAWIAWKESRG